MKSFFHWLSHRFKWNEGTVISWTDKDVSYIGFRCAGCGKIDPETINKIDSEFIKMAIEDGIASLEP